jgi:hypothetical protein
MKRWRRGDTVILRYPAEQRMVRAYQVTTGRPVVIVAGWPHVVLEDSDDLFAAYIPEGTKLWPWEVESQQFRFREPGITQGESIRLFFPGKPYEVSLFYETGSGPAPHVKFFFPGLEGRFYGWKVDITSPFARTEAGLDMIDEVLDIMVKPDYSYRWKDEDQMAVLVDLGIYTASEADSLRRVGGDVEKLIEAHAPPFDDSWVDWRPDPDLVLGPVPDGWQHVPLPAPYVPYDLSEDKTERIAAAARLRDSEYQRFRDRTK